MKFSEWTWSSLILAGFAQAQADSSVVGAFAGEGVPTDDIPANAEGIPGLYQAEPYDSKRLDRGVWKASCDSENTGYECSKAIDGNNATFWETAGNTTYPHFITVDIGSKQNVSGIAMIPRRDGSQNGWIVKHRVFTSTDGNNWGQPVAYGIWYSDDSEKLAVIEPQPVRYVRLESLSGATDSQTTSIADLNIYGANSYNVKNSNLGEWGATIDLPIVPVAAAVEPNNGKVLVWSSWGKDRFGGTPGGVTQTSIWDPKTADVSHRVVTNTHHDMFCPGISMDPRGYIVVTGGNDAERTSIYVPFNDTWIIGADMTTERGYQATTTLSDGRIFAIGGSWSGEVSDSKNGEIYDPIADEWSPLDGALVKPMLTNDATGPYHADNHGWLFAWKNTSIFQAGPSKAMNWYSVEGQGSVSAAGSRLGNSDEMSGNAVMFDASAGRILTFGGSPNYEDSDSVNNAALITLRDPNNSIEIVQAGQNLRYSRVFHTSVVLPDGSVFIAGGQRHGMPFVEDPQYDNRFTPERYIPKDDSFITQQPNSIVRVYHSISLLLPDATVMNGGGGLCANCSTNHYNLQVYTPPYLFTGNGSRATRPEIKSVSSAKIGLGGQISITTGSSVATASLIRYGTTTHTVNTDQRRIPLNLVSAGGNNSYTVSIPDDGGIALPGYWMLFVLDGKGVPSEAATIQITL
ncbi:uncharacterized protein TRUGW13939_11802 [Talaromyces rugulosus]|uniref:F5/8 type C domain-containing protein n=1 Tax=Talaromyces rugulosus TaxID=121627 RepID=A0A7H8RET3_TALRU|nr:uncharacterized protein TRUGW13939_11802 [Talaromyces rugulosus]QKX64627.1 hypothetical protein TRUGW13939_11802 [Talaromyces rugulosus]